MEEELTAAMHSEFTVDDETDLKLKCWSALDCIKGGLSVECVLSMYAVTMADLEANISEYNSLFLKKISLE